MSAQRARIAARAYELWERRGRPEGSPDLDWAMAEKEISAEANDPEQPKAALAALQQEAAKFVTSASDKGPIPSTTENTLPAGTPNRSRPRRNVAGQGRDDGASRD
jgi:hypothetical protein